MVIDTKLCTCCGASAPLQYFAASGSDLCRDCRLLKGKKTCSRCKNEKLFEEFQPNKRYADGHEVWCSSCKMDHKRLKRFGLPIGEFQRKQEIQGFKCMLCKRERPLCVDHDHADGQIRGLLCRKCNTAIGLLDENVELLREAIRYIEFWKSKSQDMGHDAYATFGISEPTS